MNTLTKGFAKRVISALLATIMVFSLGIVGLTSTSAANVDLAETGLTVADNETLYCLNSYTNGGTWEDDAWDNVVMTDIGEHSRQFAIDDYPVENGDIYFKFGVYRNNNKYYFYPGTDGDTITAQKDVYVSPSNSAWEGENNYYRSWKLSLDNLKSYSTVDIYIEFDNSNNNDGIVKVYVFDCKVPTYVTNPTAVINPKSIVLGNSADITVGYTLSGTSNTPTLTLCDTSGNAIGSGTADVTVNGKVITVTPKVASDYTFQVKISVDGVDAWTNTVDLQCKEEYSASLNVDNNTKYTDDNFTFTITDNSELYDGATYVVYCNDEIVTPTFDGKTFTASHATAGDYTYKVVATVDGEDPVTTNEVTITVKAKNFSVYLTAPRSTMEDHAFTVTATHEFATEGKEVTYTLKYNDGTEDREITNTTGNFSITIWTVGNYTLTVIASDGVQESVTDTATVEITEDKGTYPVKILFKCSDTYGYLPNAKVDGTAVELTKDSTIITYNATDTATYSWYSYTSGPEVEFGTDIVFSVNANRNYFYNASFTVSAGEGDFVQGEDGYYYYYLALENLNGGTSVLSNISKLDEEAERNWTESAVNMIYDAADAMASVGVNFAYAKMNDANTDGKVNIKDATYIQKSLANVVEASALSTAVSDVNNDGKVTIKDATALQKQLANL